MTEFGRIRNSASPMTVSSPSSESEDEGELERWDMDCKIVEISKSGEEMRGYHLMPSCSPDSKLTRSPKKIKTAFDLQDNLLDKNFMLNFKHCWTRCEPVHKDNVELIAEPFKLCVINDFVDNVAMLNRVREEFSEVEWNKRNVDLYEFFQSSDLKHVNSSLCIQKLYDFLKTDVMQWVESVTGLQLDHISATCSFYSDTDYLLVHDDQQEDRMIAFVLYLAGPCGWKEEYGGALELLTKDEAGQPDQVVRRIFPVHNQFVFFQVANDSFHQVAEVMNKNDCRLSINGWFHAPIAPVFKAPYYTPLPNGLFGSIGTSPIEIDLDLESWVNGDYLLTCLAKNVQEIMEEQSEIALENYFKLEAMQNILEDLHYDSIEWEQLGPPNRCRYEVAKENTLPQTLGRLVNLFKSKQMFKLLKDYTDLDLTTMKCELQRWTPQCYSLLSDYDWSSCQELDVIIFLGCPKCLQIIGGNIMYISTDEEIQQSLVTINPKENVLNIIFRDTSRIVKYVSNYSTNKCYYLLICSYKE